MRTLAAVLLAGCAVAAVQPVFAADPVPVYHPPVTYPKVDDGLKGAFYLRGSVGGNLLWGDDGNHPTIPTRFTIDRFGYGYSFGAGVGYETGDGWRADVTVDRLINNGMRSTITGAPPLLDGDYALDLRSTIALANVYYDFGLGSGRLSAAGGMFGYVGAGLGLAYNDHVYTTGPAGSAPDTPGANLSLAAAGMVGAGYDFGSLVTDLGYRMVYINRIENSTATAPYSIDHNFAHEVRATVRYRF